MRLEAMRLARGTRLETTEAPMNERWTTDPRWKERALAVLARADIRVGGDRPWDLQVHDERLWHRALAQGNLGLGEAYMDGWWDCAALDQFFAHLGTRGTFDDSPVPEIVQAVKARLLNLQRRHDGEAAHAHPDLGLDLFERMLGKRLVPSAAYWHEARSLDKAQERMLDLVARKLHLHKGSRILDIDCAWGGLAAHLAKAYGAQVVGLTPSRAQAERARQGTEGLDVEIRIGGPTSLSGEAFDHIIALGPVEHVAPKQHAAFFRNVHDALAPEGLLLVEFLGNRRTNRIPDAWTNKYVFPDLHAPSLQQVTEAAVGAFTVEDVHNLRTHFDRTFMAWHANFSRHWRRLRADYGDTFRRMWDYHLLSTAGAVRSGQRQGYQVVLARDDGTPHGYDPVR